MNLRTDIAGMLAVGMLLLNTGCSEQAESAPPPGTIPPPAQRDGITFAADIKPIFDASCVKCHGEKKHKAGLRLDSREAALKGGEEGVIFETGKSAESALIHSIARVGEEDYWMPPIDKGKPLTLDQIALVRAWIDQGAN
jgi:mono/diheme cytochrome c family protein